MKYGIMTYRACPRCIEGDLYLQHDFFGPIVSCVQCGFVRYLKHASKGRLAQNVSAFRQRRAKRKVAIAG